MMNQEMISAFGSWRPEISPEAWVDPSARVIGRVKIESGVSLWPQAVLRADSALITVMERAAVLDLALLEAPDSHPVTIGPGAIVSHGAMVHGAQVMADALIGIGAIILDGAEIGAGSIIGAGSLVTAGTIIPAGSLVLGTPGKVIRPTTDRERLTIREQSRELFDKSRIYLKSWADGQERI